MNTQTGGGLDAIRRIALVTDRFSELQGLIPATLGAVLILASLMTHAGGTATASRGRGDVLIFALLMTSGSPPPLQRMYRHTFGDAVATTHQRIVGAMPTMVVMFGALF